MTTVHPARPCVVILAQHREAPLGQSRGLPLAVRRLCGVPLVRRHLQVVRACEWRQATVVVPPAARGDVVQAVGEPAALGMKVSYVEADEGTFPAQALLDMDAPWYLVLEGHYVLEGALLEALRASEANAVLCDSQPEEGPTLTMEVRNGQVAAWGEHATRPSHAFAGAVLLSRSALEGLAAQGSPSWPSSLSRLAALRAVDVRSLQLYSPEVRRQAQPLCQPVETPADAERCKRALVQAAQKHTLDVLACYVNRPLESALLQRIADWPITPNQLTALTSALAFVVTGLFLAGLWLPASLLTFVVNVLDGLDGRLARVKALSTRVGQLEHSLDLLYEQSWYAAFTWTTYMRDRAGWVLALGFSMLIWDSLARHLSMLFRQVMGIPLSDYAPFDRAFRRIDGRRNTYTLYILLGVITGRPVYAIGMMAFHAFLTSLVYFIRVAKHLHDADRGLARRTW